MEWKMYIIKIQDHTINIMRLNIMVLTKVIFNL